MASLSNYYAKIIQDALLGNQSVPSVTTVYVGLWTSALSGTSTGSTSGEVSGGSYARVSVTNNLTNWPAAAGGTNEKHNANAITFPTPSAGWGTVSYWAILDASSAGNIIHQGALTNAKTINTGDTVQFAASAISITAS